MSPSSGIVRIVEARCPYHGPREGLWYRGIVTPFPIVMEARIVEGAKPKCFDCKAVGRDTAIIVIMEPVDVA